MLQIIHNNFKLFPFSYKFDHGMKFKPGMVVELVNFSNVSMYLLASFNSNTKNLFVVDDIKDEQNDSTIASGKLTAWPLDKGLSVRTDCFENLTYRAGDLVYVNGGLFTKKKTNDEQKPVGYITAFDAESISITFEPDRVPRNISKIGNVADLEFKSRFDHIE